MSIKVMTPKKQTPAPWVWFNGDDYIMINSDEWLDGPIRDYSPELREFLMTLAFLDNESRRSESIGTTPELIRRACKITRDKYSKYSDYLNKLIDDRRIKVKNGRVMVVMDEQMKEPGK